MARPFRLPDGREVDLDYFVNWRPYLWAKPLANAIGFLGDLRGRRLLEIGGFDARISCLFAMLGAEPTMVDCCRLDLAKVEIAKWGVADRVHLVHSQGGFDEIAGQLFDVIFTKSVLWCIPDLAGFLDQVEAHLAPGGKVAFIENHRGGPLLFWLRGHVFHPGGCQWESKYHGIRKDQIPLFHERFADMKVRRPRYVVYEIFGHKKLVAGPG
jgi:SAM-dependent methyltransferase